ncbi:MULTISPECIES: Panacea domain-containing protein [Paraburkholderia]|jgi:uncharacterized phage-associated protein|uniref:Panacea domain-containing protein n=1 Tax=Paraburkholderia TaxID=1822464 RepID=UPI0038BB6C50
MAYSAMAVANAFIKRAKEGRVYDLSPMKLQKLMFYAQSWYLRHRNSPLMDDVFCRWQYGPVIPSLYHEFKGYGAAPITQYGNHLSTDHGGYRVTTPVIPDNDPDAWWYVDEVIRVYGGLSGAQLSNMTHQAGTAWSVGPPDGGPIPNNLLAERIA